MQTPKRREREGITQRYRYALRCPLPGLVHDGDHEVEKAVGYHLHVCRGSQVGRVGEEFMTQPPTLVFMCDLPLPLALSLIPPLSLRSHIAPCTSLCPFARQVKAGASLSCLAL